MFTPMTTLAEADGWWLVAACPCGRTARLPCRLLARELRPSRTIGEVARRLICRGCRSRPAEVELVDSIQLGAPGYVASGEARRVRVMG